MEKKYCVFKSDMLCVGMDCRPHPCQDFLGLDKDHYDKLKEYTIHVMVHHPDEFQKAMMEFPSYRSEYEQK